MKVAFLGTSQFACPALRRLSELHEIVRVITQPDRPAGRRGELRASPVKQLAHELCLPVDQPERINAPDVVECLQTADPNVLVVASYGQFLRPVVFDLAPFGAINIHASLLPAYRGAAPIQWALMRGEEMTGVTTFRIDAGMDTGPELLRLSLEIGPDETAGELEVRLADLGGEAICQTLSGIETGRLVPRSQAAEGASRAPLLSREDGRVHWGRPAAELHNLIRGTNPWPGAWTSLSSERVKLHRSARTGLAVGRYEPGHIGPRQDARLLVACADEFLELVEVQRECRPRTDGRAFLNGLQCEDHFT